MESLTVSSEVPRDIHERLQNGEYERIGGLIREIDTQRIVAWLREAHELAGPVVSGVLSLPTEAASQNALNLALSTMEFAIVMKRLETIEGQLRQVQKILEAVDYKIDLSFYANFRAALDLACNAFSMSNSETRRVSAMQAINRFLEAEHHYTDLADAELTNQSQIADEYLSTLCLAFVTEVRCYMELTETDTAIQRMQEGLNAVRPRIERQVTTLLTSNPAAYLHPRLADVIDLRRLTKVYRWLTPGVEESEVFEAQRKNLFELALDPQKWIDSLPPAIRLPVKSPLFDPKMLLEFADRLKKGDWSKGFRGLVEKGLRERIFATARRRSKNEKRPLGDSENDAFATLSGSMQQMETMIETVSRFEGYLAELQIMRSSGMSFPDWRALSAIPSLKEGEPGLLCIRMAA